MVRSLATWLVISEVGRDRRIEGREMEDRIKDRGEIDGQMGPCEGVQTVRSKPVSYTHLGVPFTGISGLRGIGERFRGNIFLRAEGEPAGWMGEDRTSMFEGVEAGTGFALGGFGSGGGPGVCAALTGSEISSGCVAHDVSPATKIRRREIGYKVVGRGKWLISRAQINLKSCERFGGKVANRG